MKIKNNLIKIFNILLVLLIVNFFSIFTFTDDVSAATCNVTDKGISSSPYGGTWGVHPELQKKADELLDLANDKGIKISITEGFRSKEYQDSLYAKGRSCGGSIVTNAKAGDSYHNYGLAFDVFVGSWSESYDGNGNGKSDWKEVGELGQSLGLEWGGAWTSFVDLPHFQYTWDLSISDLKKGDLPPDGQSITGSTTKTSDEMDDFQGDIISFTSYKEIFKDSGLNINNVGVDDRKVKSSKSSEYGVYNLGSKVGLVLYKTAQVASIFLLGYILLLWLVYFLAYAGMDMFQAFLLKLTFNKIDVGVPGGMQKLGIFSAFCLLVVVLILFGLIPKIFALIYSMLGAFFEFIGRISFV